jgi:hypothetical protein
MSVDLAKLRDQSPSNGPAAREFAQHVRDGVLRWALT